MADSVRVVSAEMALEACRYSGQPLEQLPAWAQQRVLGIGSMHLLMSNVAPEEAVTVHHGEWIVRDAAGRVKAVPADQFARRYHFLSADIGALHLSVRSSVFPPHVWNAELVERAAVAYHNSFEDEPDFVPWLQAAEVDRVAIRNGVRKALTAAISA